MKTIHPLALKALLDARQAVEIVDIRPRAEFEKTHVKGARSIPSAEISVEKLVGARGRLRTELIYLVSESGALAQLQACDLERQGLNNVVIVSGGMHLWQSGDLPVVRQIGVAAQPCNGRCAGCQARQAVKTAVHGET